MKICVMGSSHLGSLKLGWDEVRDQFPDLTLDFFGSTGGTMRHLRVRGSRLVPDNADLADNLAFTSGGMRDIDVSAYQAVILYGLVLRMPRLRRGISRAVLQQTIRDSVDKSVTAKLAARVRKVTQGRIWVGPSPMPVALGDQFEAGVFHDYDTLLTEVGRALGGVDVTMLAQPPATLGPDLRTRAQFGVGSVRLLSEPGDRVRAHPDEEVNHMNAQFGRLWLLQNLPVVLGGDGVAHG